MRNKKAAKQFTDKMIIDSLVEVLEFYSDEDIYDYDYCVDNGGYSIADTDNGKKARDILEWYESIKKGMNNVD